MNIVVEVPNIISSGGTATATRFIVVDAQSGQDAAVLAEGIASENGWVQWNHGHAGAFRSMISSYRQPDCIVRDGVCESKMFDRLAAESADWTKLPDWPAWSALAAREPLGAY